MTEKIDKHNIKFYGSTTVGEKGQAVIPQEAREKVKIKKGEKLLVFGMGTDTLLLCKLSGLHQIEANLLGKLSTIRSAIKKNK